jgi:hypothetical protein
MTLYRAHYLRNHHLRGMTFAARNAALAALYAYTILQPFVDSIGGSGIFRVETL